MATPPPWVLGNFNIFVEMGLHYVAHAGLKLLASSDPPTSASQVAGTTDARHHTRLIFTGSCYAPFYVPTYSAQGLKWLPKKDTAFDHPWLTLIIPLNFTDLVVKLSHVPVQEDKKKKKKKERKKVTQHQLQPRAGLHKEAQAGTRFGRTYTAEGIVTVVSSSTSFSCRSRSASISLSSSSSLVS